jgi:hypothetical protein
MFQISFPTSTSFLKFFLPLYLFFLCGNLFSRISKNGKGLTRGTHRSATASPGVAPELAVMGGTACHHGRGHKYLAPTTPVRAVPPSSGPPTPLVTAVSTSVSRERCAIAAISELHSSCHSELPHHRRSPLSFLHAGRHAGVPPKPSSERCAPAVAVVTPGLAEPSRCLTSPLSW